MSPHDTPDLNGHFLRGYPETEVTAPAPAIVREMVRLQSKMVDEFRPELILDESSLLPFHFLRTGDRLGRAVVKILRLDGGCGTGFLVAPDVVLTNHHVLPDRSTSRTSRAIANFEEPPPEDRPLGQPADVPLLPEVLFITDEELDFTFCGVEGLGHLGVIPLDRDSGHVGPNDLVNIIQHPRGRPKEVAIHDNRIVKANRVALHYLCDTEPGSSGSPVFDNQWRLVALHHASVADDRGKTTPGVDPQLRFLNEGVRLSAVALWLETDEAADEADDGAIARIRRLFEGVDPDVGFFGALGKSLRGRLAVELIAATERRDGRDLDLGFWDLGESGHGDLDRLAEIGARMAEMKLDAWVLANISPAEARTLREQLDTHFRLEYRDLPARGADGSPLIVLYRRSRHLTIERSSLVGLPEHLLIRVRSGSGRVAAIRLLAPAAIGPAALQTRVEELAAIRDGEAPEDWVLMAGPSAVMDDPWMLGATSATGPDGVFVFLPATTTTAIDRLFASPNFTVAQGDRIQIADVLPLPPCRPTPPIAARLTLRDLD